jgi:hypothetical protein
LTKLLEGVAVVCTAIPWHTSIVILSNQCIVSNYSASILNTKCHILRSCDHAS